MKIKIICTLGPSSFKKNILNDFKKLGVNIFRINMSHTLINNLEKKIKILKKNKIKNICIDTEGAQIRTTKVKKKIYFEKNSEIKISNEDTFSSKKKINILPKFDFKHIKLNSLIHIGFENLILKVIKKDLKKDLIICKVKNRGFLDSNKGVHVASKINLNPLTEKDIKAINIAKKNKVRHYAISFVNKGEDIDVVKNYVNKNSVIISKIETKNSLRNLSLISKKSDALLIDRGDLSRYIPIEQMPIIQEGIANFTRKNKKPLYVATNLLETMVKETNPTRAESHDIYSTLNQGIEGLVLAAETAIGKDPVECVKFLKRCINNNNKKKIKKIQKIINKSRKKIN